MPTKDTHAARTIPQPGTPAASDDLELKSVGNGRFVATYHRNAYRQPMGQTPRKEA